MNNLSKVRQWMKDKNISHILVLTDDYHQSEYVGDYFKLREFISGFNGSAGSLVIEMDKAFLFTDSRYFLQATNQLKNSGIELRKVFDNPETTYFYYLEHTLKKGDRLYFDSKSISATLGIFFKDLSEKIGFELVTNEDIANDIWEDRPSLPMDKVYVLDENNCANTVDNNIEQIRDYMKDRKCAYHVLSSLDDIAYILNMRGSDIHCCPIFLSYMVIGLDFVDLYIDSAKLDENAKKHLDKYNINCKPYMALYDDLCNFSVNSTVLIDKNKVNYAIYETIHSENNIYLDMNVSTLMKACKTKKEIENMKKVHLIDAIAMVKFMHFLKTTKFDNNFDEVDACEKLFNFRSESRYFIGESFDTIAGYKEHGAIVHYAPTKETAKKLENSSMILVDSGGQYFYGTTDITRTFGLGPVTDDEKRDFTTILKAHLALSNAKFICGTTGFALDALAKEKLWAKGINYNHGTGHGVGYLLNVHEGPARISSSYNSIPLRVGMVLSNEPGVYKENQYGIRIENLITVKKYMANEFGQFLEFENLTMVPIDLDLVDKSLLTDEEIEQLNNYHKMVWDNVSPLICNDDLLEFLKKYTREI